MMVCGIKRASIGHQKHLMSVRRDMPKDSVQKLVEELVDIFLLNEEELIKLHKVGKRLPKKRPPKLRSCGTKEFEDIANRLEARIPGLRISEDKLYTLRKYSQKFNQLEVRSLLTIAKEHDITLTWSHIHYSLSLEPREERFEYLKQCLQAGMSGQQLLEDKLKDPKNRKSEGGRKPRTTLALLERIAQLAKAYTLTSQKSLTTAHEMRAQEKSMPRKNPSVKREAKRTQLALEKLQAVVKEMQSLIRRIAKPKRT